MDAPFQMGLPQTARRLEPHVSSRLCRGQRADRRAPAFFRASLDSSKGRVDLLASHGPALLTNEAPQDDFDAVWDGAHLWG
jgi:hypothetical protein